ncbi:MAG TPA: immunoglobulin domain-containing protein, partial [Candidatus Hydrogenedentes bacterium]|nr:immunoglobulin domain-containing protein [Candidatus Hydrogenedentota bacterium]
DSSTNVAIVTAGRTSTLNLTSLGFNAEGSYYCLLNDTGDSIQSEYGVLYVRNNLAITQHPQNTTKNEYETAQFNVVTNERGGLQPLHYEWKWYHGGSWVTITNGDHVSGSGSQVSGADTDTLSIELSGDGVMDAGNYRVTVSDSGTPTPQSVTSNSASLTVTIHMNGSLPAEIRAYTGEALAITATVDNGVPPYSFTWSKGGTPIPGAPSNITLNLGTADAGDIGSYTVVVDDTSPANPPITLGPSVVSVANAPVIVTNLSDVYVYEGTNVQLSVGISGGFLPLVHTWREGGVPMGAPDNSTLDLGIVTIADDNGHAFDVVAVDQGSTISGPTTLTSQTALLYVGTPITYTRNPGDFRVYSDEPPFVMDAMFEGGLFPASYEWLRNPSGTPDETSLGVFTEFIEGNSVVLTVNPAGEQGLYDYRVCITDAVDTACSTNGSVEFADHIEFEKPLQDTTIPLNEDYRWSVTVKGGLEPVSYGWFKDDGAKAWQDLGVYTSYVDFIAPDTSDDGLYMVEVSEADSTYGAGKTITSEATLKVGYSIPVASITGLAALAALAGGLGVLRIRRKK